ncbi:hypothetical protein BT63DRAFT_479358 [Microthyrium microscopicum]|uniref:Integral membrane protein n=1 Tax=Microthyrium microscopicum TaxID=703497 RepID=A0A6A6UBA5_9PEZI|nr:hypothetical protein BT63DRAFT_479358 [Microthyrium microscopicum]
MPSSSAVVYTVLATSMIILFFTIYGQFHYFRDPGSIFFKPERALERSYSLYREQEAKTFRTAALSPEKPFNRSFTIDGKNATICGVFVTVRRDDTELHPLEISISSALAGLDHRERDDLDLRVYIADTKAELHQAWLSPLLDSVDNVTCAGNITSASQLQELQNLEREHKGGTKVALDFSYALRYAYETSSSPYIALFEDDIIFANGWLARALIALRDIDERTNKMRNTWLDLRLFNEIRSIGWASKELLGNNVPFIILGFSVGIICILWIPRYFSAWGKRLFTNGVMATICCVAIPLFVILFFQAGKQSILPTMPGVKLQPWGCCTQGIIIPRENVLQLSEELARKAATPPDMIIGDYATKKGLSRFALDPVQVQHLGIKSRLSPDRKALFTPWSVAFEDLKVDRLSKDHERMLIKLYGQ